MAWYFWVLIVVGALFILNYFASKVADRKYKKFIQDISTWQVGDKLRMTASYMLDAKKNGYDYPKLVKWNDTDVIVDMGDNMHTLVTHSVIIENRDDFWRMKYASMNKFMRDINKLTEYKPKVTNEKGEEVEVESKMDIKTDGGFFTINDMPIEGMSEVHLTIFLKYAIEEKNHKLAGLLREELKKWR
jgi:hypothetical protein